MPRFFACKIHCEELVDPPVLAVFALTPIDQATLLMYRDSFNKMKKEHGTLLALSFNEPDGIVQWFPASSMTKELIEATQDTKVMFELTSAWAKDLRLDEPQVGSTVLQVDSTGVMACADIKHSNVEVITRVLLWSQLERTTSG